MWFLWISQPDLHSQRKNNDWPWPNEKLPQLFIVCFDVKYSETVQQRKAAHYKWGRNPSYPFAVPASLRICNLLFLSGRFLRVRCFAPTSPFLFHCIFFHLSYCHLPLIAPVSRLTRPWRVLSSLKSLYGVTNLCSVHLGKRKKTQKESRTTHVFSNPMLQDQHSPCWLNEPIHTKGGKSCKLTDVWGSDGRRGVYVLTRRRY